MSEERREIDRLKLEVKKLQKLAYLDGLTELYNRRGFEEVAEGFLSELVWSRKQDEQRNSIFIKSFSVALFDIDDFKKVNDTFGHEMGDKVLVRFAETLRDNVRDIDISARWGGEEFILGLVGASEEDAFKVADKIRKQVSEDKLQMDGKAVHFTVSGGVVGFDETGGLKEMFRRVDKALYEAKNSGKNRIVRYNSG